MTDALEPENFYTGLVAELYGPLRSERFDPAPYAAFIRRAGEPALELGCGDGEPMLELRAMGLNVEGLDSSLDMLQRFESAADARSIPVTLHHSTFQDMELDKQYRSIFLAGATFNLLPDDESAQTTLERIATHLHPEGSALIPLFKPEAPVETDIGSVRETTTANGAVLRLTVVDIERDETRRNQTTKLRYERTDGGRREIAERSWLLHWFEQDQFADMASTAGLDVRSISAATGEPATTHDTAFTFILGLGLGSP